MSRDSSIRMAEPRDLARLRDIFRRASLSNAGDRDALLGAPDALVWDGAALAAGSTTVAMDDRDRVLGFVTVVPCGPGLELEDLFVDPEHMRRGLATRLVAAVAASASEHGVPWIEVTANPHAAEFYASAGFTAVGRVETRFGPAPRLRRASSRAGVETIPGRSRTGQDIGP